MKLEYSLHLEPFVFCCLQTNPFPVQDIVMTFREQEGMTYILTQASAEAYGIEFEQPWAWISVDTPTQLNATGITAHIATILGTHEISCNVVAAFHHDHLFVPFELGSEALRVLRV